MRFILTLVLAMIIIPASAKDKNAYQQVTRHYIYQQKTVPVYQYKIIHTYPHHTTAYTEGLVMNNGLMYEGTGIYGKSTLYAYDLTTAKIKRSHELKKQYFGEGVTVMGNKVFQLTYKSNVGFVYDKKNFRLLQEFHYPWQGWGLTHDNKNLIMSNGSAALISLDPITFKMKNYITVFDDRSQVGFLNELEYIDGIIYANIWQTSIIAMINPKTGKVTGWIDLHEINPDPKKLTYPHVLNGIAYDTKNKHLLVTGKNWPAIYAIELIRKQ